VVAAAIARTAAARGEKVAVFKPALSGLDEDGEPDHELLRRAAGSAQPDDEVAPHRFGPPVSPHLAAEMAGEEIEPDAVLAAARRAGDGADLLVCEGVGGFLVPITREHLVRDFAQALGFPVVLAASPGLGTINHTLLTAEAVRLAGLELASIVLTPWPAEPGEMERDNLRTIAERTEVSVRALPELDLSDPGGWPALPTD
jgi:dethiobiotin synthetase